MHSSLIFLTLCSIVLIIFMVTCFICFIRSRREEDEELVEQVQYNAQQQQQQQNQQQQQYNEQARNQQQLSTPQRQKLPHSPSNNMMINDGRQQYDQQQQNQIMADYQARNSYALSAASPYHSPSDGLTSQTSRQETRSDITQQINSAIIGSSEAEFQNDFIQVFPMYQIAPQPEKNTTPYLT